VARQLKQLLEDPLVPARCREMRAKLAGYDGLETAADCLEQLAAACGISGTAAHTQ
jgi:UDP:flavonoid glycosyltransferase YjiC (YdhE family)